MTDRPAYKTLTPAEVCAKIERGVPLTLVDVRTPGEYARHHIPGVRLIPLDEFAARARVELDPASEIICICEHGVRSEMAAQYLAVCGFVDAATMRGGMAEYDGPVEVGP